MYNFNNDEILKSKKKSSISIEKIVKTIPILSSAASLISLIPRSYLKSPQTNPTQPGTDPNYIIMNLNEEYLNFNDLNQEQNQDKYFMELTSTVMCSIDNEQPEVQVAKNMIIQNDSNKIHPIFDINRKTTSPLNKYYETRLEELSFVKIFPYGINGYNNQRDQKITASAYGKCRIMSNDSRYQNNDYMFYLLAKIEEEKISNTINICSSRLKTKSNNRVNALHVYMKNLRGYSSYWNSIKSDLMAFLRNLGEPTWFITLSARDLEWPDMINALLTAYNKNNSKRQMKRFISQVTELSFQQRSKLLHDCPVVAARQFCKRFKALMKYLSKNNKILGGKIKDYWFRVEFQKRGSPHIHMLVWIEGAPAFSTAEGVKFIDDICTCSIPTDEDLKKLVLRLQVHKCTQTCYKTFMDKSKKHCRFGYLLPVSKETRILGADESIDDSIDFNSTSSSNNSSFNPYKQQQQQTSYGYTIGATNILFKQRLYDDIDVFIDETTIDMKQNDSLKKQLQLTTADLRFADYIIKHVNNNTNQNNKSVNKSKTSSSIHNDNNNNNNNNSLNDTIFEGSDDWIRLNFKLYLYNLFASIVKEDLCNEIRNELEMEIIKLNNEETSSSPVHSSNSSTLSLSNNNNNNNNIKMKNNNHVIDIDDYIDKVVSTDPIAQPIAQTTLIENTKKKNRNYVKLRRKNTSSSHSLTNSSNLSSISNSYYSYDYTYIDYKDDYNSNYLNELKQTDSFKQWYDLNRTKLESSLFKDTTTTTTTAIDLNTSRLDYLLKRLQQLDDLSLGHPFNGQMGVNDIKLKFNFLITTTESGRKLNKAFMDTTKIVNSTGKAVGEVFSQAKSTFSSFFRQ